MPQQPSSGSWATGEVLRFGPFRLIPSERRLERDGAAVKIGDRALDILLCLIASAPEVVRKEVLIRQVWANLNVEEGNLRFQIATLRQVLAEGSAGEQQFVATVQGRGYAFVAPVTRAQDADQDFDAGRLGAGHRLPMRSARIIGREHEVSKLSEDLMANRLLSVVGPGGVGKTTVAVSVAHGLLETFNGAVRFIDLAVFTDASLVPRTLASLFGVTVHSPDPINSLVALLRDKRMLVVLDSCEHVIDAAAGVAEALFLGTPDVYILLTSREPLRVEGEVVARIQPLDVPPVGTPKNAATVMHFPATELLIDRLSGLSEEFRLLEEDIPFFSEICRRLDGLPLAIELAAGLVHAHGAVETFERVGEGILSASHHEAEAPRHQTIAAMLDWSYDLLTEPERLVLQRLSTLVGAFPMEAAQAIGAGQKVGRQQATKHIAGLFAKSLLMVNVYETKSRFQLLDTTRCYALRKLRESGQLQQASRAHAEYLCEVLEEALANIDSHDADCDWTELNIGNVRAALDWCFSADGDLELGIRLASSSTAVFLDMSLWDECKNWTAKALSLLPTEAVGLQWEMRLREAFGLASMFTEGVKASHYTELERCLAIAESLGDRYYQLRVIGALIIYHHRAGNMASALDLARRSAIVAGAIGTSEAVTLSDWLLGISSHLIGNQREAISFGESAAKPIHASVGNSTIGYEFHDHRVRARCGLARSLWLVGYHRDGVAEAEKTIAEAIDLDHPVTICIALIWTAPVFLWNGDWERAERAIRDLLRYAEKHSFVPYAAYSRSAFAELKIKQGMISEGVETLRTYLVAQRGVHQVSTAPQNCTLAEGMLQLGAINEGLTHVEAALQATIERGGSYWLPEILRVKAALQSQSPEYSAFAEATFLQANRIAEEQEALSLILQIAMSTADHRIRIGAVEGAREILRSATSRFKAGQENRFLSVARDRLSQLEMQSARRTS